MRLDLNILRQKKIPLHTAINLGELNQESSEIGMSLFNEMLKTGFPILSLNYKIKDLETAKSYLQELIESNIFEEQVRVHIIGDWYNLDHKLVEKAKFLMDNTKDFDKQFLNILINYNGKEEIYSVIKLLTKKLELKQLTLEEINDQTIKDNIFNSYFLPPELIIETESVFSGILLWDSVGSKIFFGKKTKNILKEGFEFYHE